MEPIKLIRQLSALDELLLESWLLGGFARLSFHQTTSLSLLEDPLVSLAFPLLSMASPQILWDWEWLEQILEILDILAL